MHIDVFLKGGFDMVQTDKLKQMIKDNGYTYTDIGRLIGVTYGNANKRFTNVAKFSADEVYTICKKLKIKDLETIEDVFFYNMKDVC